MAETLDTLAEKVTALTTSMTNGFAAVDQRFDDVKSELRTCIEAVDTKVGLVLEKVDDLIQRDAGHSSKHAQYELQLENHDLRLIALESKPRP